MKKLIFLLCITLFSVFALAGTVSAGDVSAGYSAASITSMDGLIGTGSSNASEINTNTEPMPYSETVKTGVGVVKTAGLVGLYRMVTGKRLPLTEVGWRNSTETF